MSMVTVLPFATVHAVAAVVAMYAAYVACVGALAVLLVAAAAPRAGEGNGRLWRWAKRVFGAGLVVAVGGSVASLLAAVVAVVA